MGWCRGTNIFDSVAGVVLNSHDKGEELESFDIIKILIESLWDNDWDCESESEYYDHPLVKEVFRKINPEWYNEEYYNEDEDQ